MSDIKFQMLKAAGDFLDDDEYSFGPDFTEKVQKIRKRIKGNRNAEKLLDEIVERKGKIITPLAGYVVGSNIGALSAMSGIHPLVSAIGGVYTGYKINKLLKKRMKEDALNRYFLNEQK